MVNFFQFVCGNEVVKIRSYPVLIRIYQYQLLKGTRLSPWLDRYQLHCLTVERGQLGLEGGH